LIKKEKRGEKRYSDKLKNNNVKKIFHMKNNEYKEARGGVERDSDFPRKISLELRIIRNHRSLIKQTKLFPNSTATAEF
jgi:hypothetical protein